MPKCCIDHLIQVTHYLAELFKEKNIPYWIHFGTLLGAVRGKGIIPWDSDGDFGLFVENKQDIKDLENRMISDGYHYFQYHENLIQVGYNFNNWKYCDLWFYETIDARKHSVGVQSTRELAVPLDMEPIKSKEAVLRCNITWMQENHTTDFPKWFVDELWDISVNGKIVKSPRYPEKFVELVYGPGWKDPIPKDGSYIFGNYYSLSKWLQIVKIMKRQKDKVKEDLTETPYCRHDTSKCEQQQECCRIHIAELMSYAEFLLKKHEINYHVKNETVIQLDAFNYSQIISLAKEIDDVGYMFESYNSRNYCYITYSKTNYNFITLEFSLNQEKYMASNHEIGNKEIITWAYDALIRTIDSCEYQLHHSLLDGSKEGRHHFIPYNISWFLHYLHDAYEVCKFLQPDKKDFKFLEVGCGVGTKTKIAAFLFDAYGLEIFEPYAEIAKELLKTRIRNNFGIYKEAKDVERIIIEDALNYRKYNEYDVIYFYCPIDDFEKEVELETKICKEAKKGSVIIPPWHKSNLPGYIRETGYDEIYVKMLNQERYSRLKEFISENHH